MNDISQCNWVYVWDFKSGGMSFEYETFRVGKTDYLE